MIVRFDQSPGTSGLERLAGLAEHLAEELQRASDAAALTYQQGEQHAHGAALAAVEPRLDVSVRVGVDAARDRDPLGEVDLGVVRRDGQQRLAVGPDEVAQSVRHAGQRTTGTAVLEQGVRAQGARGEDDATAGLRARVLRNQAPVRSVVTR